MASVGVGGAFQPVVVCRRSCQIWRCSVSPAGRIPERGQAAAALMMLKTPRIRPCSPCPAIHCQGATRGRVVRTRRGIQAVVEGCCLRLEAEGYHVESRKLSLKAWADAASTRFYVFALDVKRAPRTALTRALEMVDALQAARGQRPPAPIQDALLVPGTWLWEQHVQPLVAPTVGGAAQPVGRAREPTENDSSWEREAERLRSLWRSQGFEHHGARPWTEVPLNPPLLQGLPRKARVAELVELGFLWASKKLGLSPLSAQDRPSIVANLLVGVSQNPCHKTVVLRPASPDAEQSYLQLRARPCHFGIRSLQDLWVAEPMPRRTDHQRGVGLDRGFDGLADAGSVHRCVGVRCRRVYARLVGGPDVGVLQLGGAS